MRVGVLQLNVSDDPVANLPVTQAMIADAAGQGARLICTPEMTGALCPNRMRLQQVIATEEDDPTLAALQDQARALSVWIALGSLAINTGDRAANRSFLIAPDGSIAARYDKIHMFDVAISETETFRESASYAPGDRAVLTEVDGTGIGMCICYDLRFGQLAIDMAKGGVDVLLYPSAFAVETGQAHWEVLLRARAIETGSFVVASAQTGTHETAHGTPRRTYGHAMVVGPWGDVLLDAGTEPGVHVLDLDLSQVSHSRRRLPTLRHQRDYVLDRE